MKRGNTSNIILGILAASAAATAIVLLKPERRQKTIGQINNALDEVGEKMTELIAEARKKFNKTKNTAGNLTNTDQVSPEKQAVS